MKAVHYQRRCDQCGQTYHRVNKVHLWPVRNPGHRTGWLRQEVKLCNACLSPSMAQKVLTIAQVRIVRTQRRKIA